MAYLIFAGSLSANSLSSPSRKAIPFQSFSMYGDVFRNTEICPDDISYIGIIFRIHPSLPVELSALKSSLTI